MNTKDAATFVLDLPPGLSAASIFPFQARDPQSICEWGDQTRLLKGLFIGGRPVLLELTAVGPARVVGRALVGPGRCPGDAAGGASGLTPAPAGPAADATVGAAAERIARRLLGFVPDPAPFEAAVARDPRFAPLRPLVAARPGLRIPQTASVWEGLAWAIIGQQINLSFAFQLRRELVRLAGRPLGVVDPRGEQLYAFPEPAAVAALDYADLQRCKYSRRKAEYLIDAARLIAAGELPCEELPDLAPAEVERRLLAVRGIGPWSANYVAMRACAFPDCVPVGDTGLSSGLQRLFALDHRPGPHETRALMAPFAPYRSLVTFHLWRMGGGGA